MSILMIIASQILQKFIDSTDVIIVINDIFTTFRSFRNNIERNRIEIYVIQYKSGNDMSDMIYDLVDL